MTQSGEKEVEDKDAECTSILVSLIYGGRISITSFKKIGNLTALPLRTRMSYHKFPNLGELLQGDLVSKLRKGLASNYFINK